MQGIWPAHCCNISLIASLSAVDYIISSLLDCERCRPCKPTNGRLILAWWLHFAESRVKYILKIITEIDRFSVTCSRNIFNINISSSLAFLLLLQFMYEHYITCYATCNRRFRNVFLTPKICAFLDRNVTVSYNPTLRITARCQLSHALTYSSD